jgi:hypothetical protein
MYLTTLFKNNFDNMKSAGLCGGYIVLWFMLVKFLNILKYTLPDVLFYLFFSYISVRIYEVCNNDKLITLTDKFDNLMFECSYDVILWYSKGQIIIGKIFKNVVNVCIVFNDSYIKDTKFELFIHQVLNIETKKEISGNNILYEFIKNGEVINSTVSLKNDLIEEDKYDFVLLSNESTKYKKIIQKKDVVDNLNDTSIVPSNVSFMVFQLNIPFFNKYDDESLFDLHLSSSKYNFLVNNNCINKDFLLFFINNYYSSEIMNLQHLNGCEIRFVDKYANFCSVDLEKQFIHIYENNYEIKDIVNTNFSESDEDYEFTKVEYNEIVNEENIMEENIKEEIVTDEIDNKEEVKDEYLSTETVDEKIVD